MAEWGWILIIGLPHVLQLDQSQWSCFGGGHRGVFLPLSPCVGRTASELWLGMVGAESQGHFRIYSQTEISRPAFGADRCVSFWVPQWAGLLSDAVAKCWSQVMGILQDLQLDQSQWAYL